jgi:hypothetical protein
MFEPFLNEIRLANFFFPFLDITWKLWETSRQYAKLKKRCVIFPSITNKILNGRCSASLEKEYELPDCNKITIGSFMNNINEWLLYIEIAL